MLCASLKFLRTGNVGELTRRRGTGVPAPEISPRNPRNAFTATLDARASLSGQGIAPYFLGVSQGIAGYRGVSRGIDHLGWGGQSLSDSHKTICSVGRECPRHASSEMRARASRRESSPLYKFKKENGHFRGLGG